MEHAGAGEEGSLFQILYHIGLPHWIPDIVPMTWLVILLFAGVSFFATRRMTNKMPGKLQNILELIVGSLDNFVIGIIGPDGGKFTSLIGTFFLFILSMNLLGLIPGFKSPTSNLNTTVALAVVAFILVQYHSIRIAGIKAYLLHFVGNPWWLAPLNIPIHIIGELAKPVSLSFRLYGNIFGEDMVILILATLAASILPAFIPFPVQLPMLFFGIFTSFVQALVFSMLTSVYIAVGISHD